MDHPIEAKILILGTTESRSHRHVASLKTSALYTVSFGQEDGKIFSNFVNHWAKKIKISQGKR